MFEWDINVSYYPGSPSGSGISPDCFTMSKDPSGAFYTPSLQRTMCNTQHFFMCQLSKSFLFPSWVKTSWKRFHFILGQSLAQNLQPYLSTPVVVLPLSQSSGPNDVGDLKLSTTQTAIAYDTLYSPAGFIGSAMFTSELNQMSNILVNTSMKIGIQTSLQMTLMGWIRPDKLQSGTVLVIANS